MFLTSSILQDVLTATEDAVASQQFSSESEEITDEHDLETKKGSPRLPRALTPLHYLVKLQPLINGNFSILGYVEVEMEVLQATSNITLHIADIITHNDTVKVSDAQLIFTVGRRPDCLVKGITDKTVPCGWEIKQFKSYGRVT